MKITANDLNYVIWLRLKNYYYKGYVGKSVEIDPTRPDDYYITIQKDNDTQGLYMNQCTFHSTLYLASMSREELYGIIEPLVNPKSNRWHPIIEDIKWSGYSNIMRIKLILDDNPEFQGIDIYLKEDKFLEMSMIKAIS
jgi:hypothetical protein